MTKRPAWQTEPVTVVPGDVRMSPEAMRMIKKATGRTITELTKESDDEADGFQVMTFGELYRRALEAGHMPDAGALWELAGQVEIQFASEDMLADPLGDGSSQTSPPSVTSGG